MQSQQTDQPSETVEDNLPQQHSAANKTKRGEGFFAKHFSATKIAYMAAFTALAYVVTFLEFPVFPAVPVANQLKLDFANVFFLIEGYVFGPVEAIISIIIKELLCLADSQTMGVGEVANFIMSTAYVLAPSVAYKFFKSKNRVIIFLVIACVIQVAVSFVVNMVINFPFFGKLFGFDGTEAFWNVWQFVIYFNLIKSAVVSLIVFLIYKPLSRLIKKTAERFGNKKRGAPLD